jgi:hypothetical protein
MKLLFQNRLGFSERMNPSTMALMHRNHEGRHEVGDRHTDTPTHRHTDTPTHRHTDTPTQFTSKLICLLLAIFFMTDVNAQHTSHPKFLCGTVVTPETERMILEKVTSEESRLGLCDDLPLNTAPKKYKLILEIVKNQDGTTTPTQSQMVDIRNFINERFNPLGITFTFFEFQQNCNNCGDPFASGWSRTNPILNTVDFKDCLWGRLSTQSTTAASGQATLETGRFWANFNFLPNITHELGHTLGLLHTFNNFSATNNSNNELIKNDGSCTCNCKQKGDLICDTPVDPFVVGNSSWNSAMFDQVNLKIKNLDNRLDNCNNGYTLLNNGPFNTAPKIFFNLMSPHIQDNPSTFLSPGQASFMKNYSSGRPWEVNTSTSSGGMMEGGFTVNSPTTINVSKNITGDIIINSRLTLNNATLEFLENSKVVINSGGQLILNNSHLKAFKGMECIPAAQTWKGVKTQGPGFSRVTLQNKSSISDALIGIESISNPTVLIKVLSGSNINSFWNTSLKLNCLGIVDVYDSYINGVVDIQNFSNVHFSNSRLNSPEILGTVSNFVNTTTSFTNNSYVVSPLEINNTGIKNINIRNSSFLRSIFIKNGGGTSIIRDNPIVGSLTMINCAKFDVYNNNFNASNGLTIDGFGAATNPLVAKNIFNVSAVSYKHNNRAATSILQCNSFNVLGTNDLNLLEPFALNQGSNILSAGNIFSRTNTEISYSGDQKINYFFKNIGTEEPINIGGPSATLFQKLSVLTNSTSACALAYPNTPAIPAHCKNGVRDGNELGIDCGGSCPPCVIAPDFPSINSCTNGIKDGNETGIDCGGSCPPCHCKDGIQNNGEVGIDCGGPCPACFTIPQCQNGIMDGNETGIDCGGSCSPCSDGIVHCYNGVLDGNETGIDCGGSCPPCTISYLPSCYNGVIDGNETGIDCGGICPSCGSDSNPPVYSQAPTAAYQMSNHTPFVTQLNGIYGTEIPLGNDIHVLTDFNSHRLTLDNGNSCALQSYIINNSATNPALVLQRLQSFSPNVSANSIHILFTKSQYFTSAQIANILALNPAVVQDQYISYILYKTNTFTSTQKASIISAVNAGSLRQTKEAKLSVKLQYKNAILRDNIVTQGMNFPLNFNLLRTLMAQNPEITKVFEIAQSYADQKKFDLAIQALNEVDLCQLTDPNYRAQLTGMIALYTIEKDNIGKGFATSEVQNILSNLVASEHGIATDIAKSKLISSSSRSSEISFTRWQYDPLKFRQENEKEALVENEIFIFPNPATNVINVSMSQFTDGANTTLFIKNMEGKILSQHKLSFVASQISIADLPTGMYYIQVEGNGRSLETKKFIKVK